MPSVGIKPIDSASVCSKIWCQVFGVRTTPPPSTHAFTPSATRTPKCPPTGRHPLGGRPVTSLATQTLRLQAPHANSNPAPRREIGFVFQRATLMPWRTVLDNIALPLETSLVPHEERLARAHAWVLLMGLDGFAGAYPAQLSGGMQQRVALARALIHEPSILLLDEPFGSLDALTRERMNAELLRIWTVHQRTVVMVTHSISEAVFLADRVLVMSPRPGRVRAEFAITLPRPRPLMLTSEPEFMALARAVRAEIVDSD